MSTDRDVDEDVQVDVDVEGDDLQIERRTVEMVRIDRLFQPVDGDGCDARLILWSDSAGFSGYERRDGDFFRVNAVVETVVEGDTVVTEKTYIEEASVDSDEVAEAIRRHIEDKDAGGAGRFKRGCSPPSAAPDEPVHTNGGASL